MPQKEKKESAKKKSQKVEKMNVFGEEELFDDDTEPIKKPSTEPAQIVFEDSFSENDERFSDDLSEIYGHDTASQDVDMNTFDQKRKRGKMIVAAVCALLLLIGIGYGGYRIFHSVAQDNEGGNVEFSFIAPEEVASGETVTIELKYTNTRNAPIDGTIELFYPSGFLYQESSIDPVNGETTMYEVSDLQPGDSETIGITGQLIGSTDAEKEFSALFTYTPANFSSTFQENAAVNISITSSLIDMAVEAPEQVQSGEEFSYTMTFENTSDNDISDIYVQAIYPEGFDFVESTPDFFENNDQWFFESLDANSEETIEIKGKLSAESGSAQPFQLQIGFLEEKEFIPQVEETVEITVVNPEIEISLAAPEVVTAGSVVPVEVTVNNTSEATLQQIEVFLSGDDAFFETTEATTTIESLEAGSETTVVAEMTILENPRNDTRTGVVTATIPTAFVEGVVVEFPNEESITLSLQGSFEASVSGGKPDVSGDVPTAGEQSFYTIYWNIENSDTTIEGFRMATTLPLDVEWAGDASSDVVYDRSTGEVSYEKETLAEGFEKQIAFTVSITPDSKDVGKTMELTNDTIAIGIDAFTGQDISFSYPSIQTSTAVKNASKTFGNNDLEN